MIILFKKIKKQYLEQLHVLFWILKDMLWCIELKPLAIGLGIITILYSIFVIYLKPRLLNFAILCWILANFFWMCSDFYSVNTSYFYIPLFLLGVIFGGLSFYKKAIKVKLQ